jgi:hypothetical protein
MNNIQIENILKNDQFTQKYFIGVFARNNLPKNFSYPSAFIFNTVVKSGKGMHWLSIIFTKDKKCQFFDSLGFAPSFYGLENYIKKRSTSLSFNKHPIQSLNSNYCGIYALLFILILSRGQTFSKFLGSFDLNTEKNDLIIKKHLIYFK